MHIVYVLTSLCADKTYVGYTADLPRRMLEHNHTGEGFTKRYRPWKILFTESFANKADAIRREKYLKTGKGREGIKRRRFSA